MHYYEDDDDIKLGRPEKLVKELSESTLLAYYYKYRKWVMSIPVWDDREGWHGKLEQITELLKEKNSLPKSHYRWEIDYNNSQKKDIKHMKECFGVE